jgi:hypothetical protein
MPRDAPVTTALVPVRRSGIDAILAATHPLDAAAVAE